MRIRRKEDSRGKYVRRRRSVASQPYRLVFRSVPRRLSSSNFANLVARRTILADVTDHIHTPNLVIAPLEVHVARPSEKIPEQNTAKADKRANSTARYPHTTVVEFHGTCPFVIREHHQSAVVSEVGVPRSRMRGTHYGSTLDRRGR